MNARGIGFKVYFDHVTPGERGGEEEVEQTESSSTMSAQEVEDVIGDESSVLASSSNHVPRKERSESGECRAIVCFNVMAMVCDGIEEAPLS